MTGGDPAELAPPGACIIHRVVPVKVDDFDGSVSKRFQLGSLTFCRHSGARRNLSLPEPGRRPNRQKRNATDSVEVDGVLVPVFPALALVPFVVVQGHMAGVAFLIRWFDFLSSFRRP